MRVVLCLVFVLMGLGGAIAQRAAPPVDCSAFEKQADGQWHVKGKVTVELGNTTLHLDGGTVGPHDNVGGYNFYDVLEQDCGH